MRGRVLEAVTVMGVGAEARQASLDADLLGVVGDFWVVDDRLVEAGECLKVAVEEEAPPLEAVGAEVLMTVAVAVARTEEARTVVEMKAGAGRRMQLVVRVAAVLDASAVVA